MSLVYASLKKNGQMSMEAYMRKKTFKELVRENRSNILNDKKQVEKIYQKIEEKQLDRNIHKMSASR
jgi:hypothetical protein